MRGLYELGHLLGKTCYVDFVRDTFERWCLEHELLRPSDHVVPGVPLLLLYEDTRDAHFLTAARELAELYAAFPIRHGVRLHRADLPPWQDTIWVDCMYMDAPFLIRLWRMTNEPRWLELGLEHIVHYAQALHDPEGLFWHGFDAKLGQHQGCLWGRGNGWALLGLVETLEVLPEEHSSYAYLHELLLRQTRRLTSLQDDSGLWHTILPDPDTPLEPSTAALFAAGLLKGHRLGLLASDTAGDTLQRCAQRALHALEKALAPKGALLVSAATPVGDRATYVEQKLGIYPWGQGPALLAIAEVLRLEAAKGLRHHSSEKFTA